MFCKWSLTGLGSFSGAWKPLLMWILLSASSSPLLYRIDSQLPPPLLPPNGRNCQQRSGNRSRGRSGFHVCTVLNCGTGLPVRWLLLWERPHIIPEKCSLHRCTPSDLSANKKYLDRWRKKTQKKENSFCVYVLWTKVQTGNHFKEILFLFIFILHWVLKLM